MKTFLPYRLYLFSFLIVIPLLSACSVQNSDSLSQATKPQIVELQDGETYEITSSLVQKEINGQIITMAAYNGSIPGPVLKVQQGSKVNIRFTNNTKKSDTIHWHGLRLNNEFDGVPGITQKEVQPGETFDYTLNFPDDGIFMYHPHMRTNMGTEAGLYGNILVTPKNTSAYAPVNQEIPLFIDDILIENKKIPEDGKDDAVKYAIMGRFGNTMLINGETSQSFTFKKNEVVRFYFSNIANTRTFALNILGAKLKLVGADIGKYEKETFTNSVLLSPGERAIVDVLFLESGNFNLIHSTPDKNYDLAQFSVEPEVIAQDYSTEFQNLKNDEEVSASFAEVKKLYDEAPQKTLKIGFSMKTNSWRDHMGMMWGMMSGGGGMSMGDGDAIEWEDTMGSMNKSSTSKTVDWKLTDATTKKTNLKIDDWIFQEGDLIKIRIINNANSMHPMQHPVHFHGNRFAILAMDGVQNENLAWKDTVLVPNGSTADIVLEASTLGTWLTHCHILEHAESGMVMTYTIIPKKNINL